MADAPAPKPDTEQQPDPVVQEADTAEALAETTTETVAEAEASSELQPAAVPPAEAAAPDAEASAIEEPAPASTTPTVASTVDVPASLAAAATAGGDQEGGEWDLLVQKLRDWIASGQLQEQWQAARTPLSLLAGLIAVLLVLRVYSAVLNVLDSIPLVPGLLELVGVFALVQFSLRRLVRSDDRREVITGLQQRWKSFRGRG